MRRKFLSVILSAVCLLGASGNLKAADIEYTFDIPTFSLAGEGWNADIDRQTFVIESANDTEPLPEKTKIEMVGQERLDFGTIDYDKCGLYQYYIYETNTTEAKAMDATQYRLDVYVVRDDAGEVVSNCNVFVEDNKVSDLVFANTYKNIYTLTFNPNGGNWNGNTDLVQIKYAEGEVIEIYKAPTKDGYKFTYWKGSSYQPYDKYEVTEDHTFTAQWELIEQPKVAVPTTGYLQNNLAFIGGGVCMISMLGIVVLNLKKKHGGNA